MSNKKTQLRGIVALLAVICATAFGCGGDSATGPTVVDYSGSWEGTTGENRSIRFTIQGQQVTTLSVSIAVSMGFNSGTCAYTFESAAPVAISGSSFVVPVSTTSGINYETTVRGSFSSASAASGTIDNFSVSGMVCGGQFTMGTPVSQGSGTWSASRR